MTTTKRIGFDRPLELTWLDATAARVAEGAPPEEVREYLWRLLDGVLPGDTERSARHKTITVLSRIWSTSSPDEAVLHRLAIHLLPEVTPVERMALHWSLAIGAYPFFFDLVSHVGNMTALQGDVSLQVLRRRLADEYGDRSTTATAVQRLIRSVVNWGALKDTALRGTYKRGESVIIQLPALAEVLFYGVLSATDRDALPAEVLPNHPALFPFEIEAGALEWLEMPALEVVRDFESALVHIIPQTERNQERSDHQLRLKGLTE